MARAVSVHQLMQTKFEMIKLDGKWATMLGPEIELSGGIFIWGRSGIGKTRFILELVKYLSKFEKVVYNSLEEGVCSTTQIAWQDAQMVDAKGRVLLLDKEPIASLMTRLEKRSAPRICVIDSFQVSGLSFKQWLSLKDKHKNKLFIFSSQADGKDPRGAIADDVRSDCSVKIFIHGFVAFPASRYNGNKPHVIWEEGARRFHGDFFIEKLMTDGS